MLFQQLLNRSPQQTILIVGNWDFFPNPLKSAAIVQFQHLFVETAGSWRIGISFPILLNHFRRK